MKKQGIAAVALTCVMVLGLTACGGSGSASVKSKAKSYSKYVTLGDYKGIEYSKEVAEVTEDDIQSKIDSFLQEHAETEEITDRAVEDGDTVNIDFVGTVDGKEFDGGSATSYELEIGSNSFIDGFESGLIGHNIGEEVSLDLTFPEGYSDELGGKDVNFAVTINSISQKKVPKLTDKLVADNTDYDTVKAYKNSIKEDLEATNESNAENQAKSDIFDKVVSNAKISGYDESEVKDLVDKEFESFKKTADSYSSYGYSYEDVLKANGYEDEKSLKEGITQYVKSYLDQKMVLYCIAEKEGITVSSEETDKMVKEYMDTYQVETEEEVYEYLGDEYFEIAVLSDKVMDFLEKNAVLVDSTESADTEAEDTTEATTEKTSKEDTEEASTQKDSKEDTEEASTKEADQTTQSDQEEDTTEASTEK